MARQIDMPPDARALTTLERVDYEDAFLAETGEAQELTGEEWARAILEGAPASTRRALRSGWGWLGLKLGPEDDPRLVLGWTVGRSSPDFALLTTDSRFGLDGEVLCMRRPEGVLVCTFIRLKHPIARAVWAWVAPGHRQVVPKLLGGAMKARARGVPAYPVAQSSRA